MQMSDYGKVSSWQMRSEDNSCCPMITHTIDQFMLDPKSKQDKFKDTSLN